MGITKRETRQRMYETLSALQRPSDSNQGTFAAREAVPHSKGFILKSFNVEGAGELHLPLSAEDASKLRGVCEEVPFGNDLDTTMDTEVRRHFQVDASKVTFPRNTTFLSDTVQSLAVMAVRALGLDGAWPQLGVHLSKLLVYETGGPVTFQTDTEEEKGVFATLILQLPTEEGYTGGELFVKHDDKVKSFDSQIISRVGFCSTICIADCLHELRTIEAGSMLSLAFNLVNGDSSLDRVHRDYYISSRVQIAEAALEPWLKEAMELQPGRLRSTCGEKFAIPLQHRYTEEELSFTGLRGIDKLMVDVLKGCRDQNKDKCLDLHLCLVTKQKYGDAARLTRFNSYVDKGIRFRKWIGLNNQATLAFQKLEIDMYEEVVGKEEDLFDSQADEKEYAGPRRAKGMQCTCGKGLPVFEFQFPKAMIVAWPKAVSVVLACETSVPSALDYLETTLEISDPNFCRQLHQVIRYCEHNAVMLWGPGADGIDSVTSRLINLCKQANALEDVLLTFQLLAKTFPNKASEHYAFHRHWYASFQIGVRNIEVAEAIVAAIEVFGWESVSASVIGLVNKCALGQGEAFAEIARQLVIAGIVDAGEQVASAMPTFTWRQPLAHLPDYPVIEKFLRGPLQSFFYMTIPDLAEATSFAETYFNINQEKIAYAGYSALARPGGRSPLAFCRISKTDRVFKIAMEGRRKERENLRRLKDGVERRMSAISKLSARSSTSPNSSDQPDSKRQRLDTKETVTREKSTPAR